MNDSSAPAESKKRTLALILLPLLAIALAGVVIYINQKAKEKGMVTVVVAGESATAAAINTGDVIDATLPGVALEPLLGRRYKVFVEDESDDRSSGIAKIGGRATFIPGARRGQIALVDTTRVRDRVVDAILVKVLSTLDLPPKPPREAYVPAPDDATAQVVPGAEMDVIITETSSRNPTTEGVAKVSGLVVFVNGATAIGERVNIRITERRERLAFAELTGQPAGTSPLPAAAEPVRRVFQPPPGDPVVPGAELDVVISEESQKNPGLEGIAKVGGLIVAVKGATTVGERVNVRIVDRMERIAFAEPTGKPAGTGPLPEIAPSRPARAPREPRPYTPPPGDSAPQVMPGAVLALTIVEPSSKNPTTEGVAKVNGLVVFVKGATTIGQTVNVKITDRRPSIAIGELTRDPVTAPVMAPVAAPAAPPPAFPTAPPADVPEPAATAAQPATPPTP